MKVIEFMVLWVQRGGAAILCLGLVKLQAGIIIDDADCRVISIRLIISGVMTILIPLVYHWL